MKKSIKFAQNLEENEVDSDEKDQESTSSRWKSFNSKSRPSVVQLSNVSLKNHQSNVTVELRVIILKLSNISTKENKFTCEAFIEASWLDKYLFDKNSNGSKYDVNKHWNPLLFIQNIITYQSQEIWYTEERVHPIGWRISERRRIRGEFSHTLNLKQFPFDIQELCISISTFRQNQEVSLVLSSEN